MQGARDGRLLTNRTPSEDLALDLPHHAARSRLHSGWFNYAAVGASGTGPYRRNRNGPGHADRLGSGIRAGQQDLGPAQRRVRTQVPERHHQAREPGLLAAEDALEARDL